MVPEPVSYKGSMALRDSMPRSYKDLASFPSFSPAVSFKSYSPRASHFYISQGLSLNKRPYIPQFSFKGNSPLQVSVRAAWSQGCVYE